MTMQHLFSPEGESALARTLQHRPLLAFDFDGTLAAIVRQPHDARPTQALVQRLAALSALLPVAVVSGRALADLRPRLGFRPAHLVGNHGAEDEDDAAATARWTVALDPLRQRLQQQAAVLGAAGVTPEDKGPSIALHYRQARHAAAALRAIELFLQGPWLDGQAGPLKVFGGKRVVNVCAAGCPDKAAPTDAGQPGGPAADDRPAAQPEPAYGSPVTPVPTNPEPEYGVPMTDDDARPVAPPPRTPPPAKKP